MRALGPVSELVECDEWLVVFRPIVVTIPVDENSNSGEANVESDGHVPDQTLAVDNTLIPKNVGDWI